MNLFHVLKASALASVILHQLWEAGPPTEMGLHLFFALQSPIGSSQLSSGPSHSPSPVCFLMQHFLSQLLFYSILYYYLYLYVFF